MADLEQIETVLAKLQNNYSELARTWYNIFYNTTPMDVTIKFYNEDGNIQTQTIPNRAKDFNYYKNGRVNPESMVSAPPATIYQNLNTGDAFIKLTGTGSSGWVKFVTDADLDGYIIRGAGAPTGNITAKLGTLYIDNVSGIVYIKAKITNNIGWQPLIDVSGSYFVHFIPTGRRVVIKVPEEIANKLS